MNTMSCIPTRNHGVPQDSARSQSAGERIWQPFEVELIHLVTTIYLFSISVDLGLPIVFPFFFSRASNNTAGDPRFYGYFFEKNI